MSLLKNLIKNGISDGISKGISKGIGDALGRAVEKAVNPAAERLAGKAAAQIDEASAALDSSAQAASDAAAEVQTAQKSGGFAALENALNGWAKNMEQAATEMSKNLKICPKCGEPASAELKFCPKCGAELPETTAADLYVCPRCGRQNTVGSEYCSACGGELPGKNVERSANVLAEWDSRLAGFPKWCFGGTDLQLDETGTDSNGRPFYAFMVCNTSNEALKAYTALLKQNGFRQKFPGADETLVKRVGQDVWVFNQTEGMYDETTISVNFSRDPADA